MCVCLLIDTRAGGIWNERVEMIVFLIGHKTYYTRMHGKQLKKYLCFGYVVVVVGFLSVAHLIRHGSLAIAVF